jgi:hypothetical protein
MVWRQSRADLRAILASRLIRLLQPPSRGLAERNRWSADVPDDEDVIGIGPADVFQQLGVLDGERSNPSDYEFVGSNE